ncbi:hypothetical protein B0T11DRAFT_52807 [Plectosphaerella cucumerina]|uniref:Uncharacterized protein n=1 Tax=Plectosphaerella cucumerina TaxID=40658 RepID=A0A8K0X4Z9_9PEZI|nr:hypothetical protein B0T11DRAFT_52807 [Plectosphaerella cucumerina]
MDPPYRAPELGCTPFGPVIAGCRRGRTAQLQGLGASPPKTRDHSLTPTSLQQAVGELMSGLPCRTTRMTDARLGMTEGQAADTVLGWCPSMSESTIGFALKKEGQSRETHHPFHRASASPTFRGLPPLSDKGALRILIKPDIAGPISRGDGLCGVKFALPVVLSGLALVPPGPQAQGAGSYFYCQDAAG